MFGHWWTVVKDGSCTTYVLTVWILVGDCRLNISVSSLLGSRVEVYRLYTIIITLTLSDIYNYSYMISLFVVVVWYNQCLSPLKFVSDLRQVGGFLWVLLFPPPIILTATIYRNFLNFSTIKNSPFWSTKTLLKVASNSITLTQPYLYMILCIFTKQYLLSWMMSNGCVMFMFSLL